MTFYFARLLQAFNSLLLSLLIFRCNWYAIQVILWPFYHAPFPSGGNKLGTSLGPFPFCLWWFCIWQWHPAEQVLWQTPPDRRHQWEAHLWKDWGLRPLPRTVSKSQVSSVLIHKIRSIKENHLIEAALERNKDSRHIVFSIPSPQQPQRHLIILGISSHPGGQALGSS